KSMWGFSKLISKKSLKDESNGYLVGDNFVFGTEVFVVKRQRVVERLVLHEKRSPRKMIWQIKEFSKLKDITYSKEFIIRDIKWSLSLSSIFSFLYLSISLSLKLYHSNPFDSTLILRKIKIYPNGALPTFEGSYLSAYFVSRWFTCSDKTWGHDTLAFLDEVHNPQNGYIVDDKLILEVEIYVDAVVL
ncbi:hypothetical protein MIMGU_mgv1a021451mg, partial [Erythranthe guttata]